MQSCDVLVVGGGPAGSSCAWKLRDAGLDVLLLDKATFPREKVCAGWITPVVLQELQIDPADYRRGRVLQPLTAFRISRIDLPSIDLPSEGGAEIQTDYGRPVSFGIRRCEFDHYLLQRSGARLQLGEPLRTIQRTGADWVINDRFRTPLLVAAGGHFCPVVRFLGNGGVAGGSLVAAQGIEFEMNARQQAECRVEPEIPELYFCDDLKGYGWCVRKGDFLNLGLGREDRERLPEHVANFCEHLKRRGRIPRDIPSKFRGHAYLLYGHSPRPLLDDGLLVVGDAAGLAYPQSGEGIRPAVESGLMAAAVILAAGGNYRRDRLGPYGQLLSQRFGKRKAQRSLPGPALSGVRRLIGRGLLSSRWFVRHVLLDRWFLHTQQPLTV